MRKALSFISIGAALLGCAAAPITYANVVAPSTNDDHILTGLFYVNDRRKYKLIVDEFNTYVFYPSLVKGIKAL